MSSLWVEARDLGGGIGLEFSQRLLRFAKRVVDLCLVFASAASLRIADILMMMDDDPRRLSFSDTRQALTVALVKPGRGACWNQAINSFNAMLYTRLVIGEETLSSTNPFNFSHWAIFSSTTKSFIFILFNGHYRPQLAGRGPT